MKCVKSVIGEFSSGVSICRNKNTQSDLGAPFLPGAPRPRGTGDPSSGSADKGLDVCIFASFKVNCKRMPLLSFPSF